MSEPSEDGQGAPVDDVQAPNGADRVPGEGQEPKTFDAAYVKGLREEAAANRVKAAKMDELVEALYESARELATAGILIDPRDLPDGDYIDAETGRPSLEAMREAAIKVADERPHLARPRPPSSQMQGPVSQQPTQAGLGSLLRDAAR